ncbi:MAG: DeoR/GlpR transcriptional regulator [Micrococcales bacterium]|nr:DeoR/GlpR transcriptional regulator [Micrococcales bacterium]
MYATERHELIATRVRDQGRVAVRQLARELDVTAETIRRDLDLLEEGGLLRRVHGGAIASTRSSIVERSLDERRLSGVDGKRRIAAAALALLPSGFDGSLLIDAGTTTAAFAERLRDRARQGRPTPVITNSVHIAAALVPASEIDLHQLGGRVRGVTAAAVGAETVAAVERMRPDVAVIGTNGVSAGFGLSTPDEFEAAVKSAFVRVGRRVIVLADAAKLGEESLVRFAALEDIDVLVTDRAPEGSLAAELEDADVEVVLA